MLILPLFPGEAEPLWLKKHTTFTESSWEGVWLCNLVLPASLTGSALGSGGFILEQAETGSVWHGGSPWSRLAEDAPAASPLPKPCHINPIQRLITVYFGFGISLTLLKQTWSFLRSWLRVWREYYLLEEVAEKSSQFTPDLVQASNAGSTFTFLAITDIPVLNGEEKKVFCLTLSSSSPIHCLSICNIHIFWDCSTVTPSN